MQSIIMDKEFKDIGFVKDRSLDSYYAEKCVSLTYIKFSRNFIELEYVENGDAKTIVIPKLSLSKFLIE